jgi:NAD(P)-dependent dehydrogenase (short-subunit alcohol dehydrogenase family)
VASVSDRIVPIVADIQRAPDIRDIVHGATKRWGRIDVVANSAGAFAQRPLENIEQQLMTDLFATNIVGPALLSQAALPYLKGTQGAIVNVSSTFRHKATPMIAHDAASKAALGHLARSWALELAPYWIQVNAVVPGRWKRAL